MQVNIEDVISRYITLKKDGQHYKGLCPFHEDNEPSLVVTPSKQIFKCFSCGESGDAYDFVQKHENVNFLEAKKIVHGETQAPTKIVKPKKKQLTVNIPAKSIPEYFPNNPTNVYEFLDINGDLLGYTLRYDKNGKKEVLPYVETANGWEFKGFPTPRPLYNLHLLTKYPNAIVVLSEGEKAANAINKSVDNEKIISLTWIGGVNSVNSADFSFLKSRKVILFPDNDLPGENAMINIYEKIKIISERVMWVNIPDGYPDKWDAADKEWSAGELSKFINSNLIEVPRESRFKPTPEPEPAAPITPTTPTAEPKLDNPHFKYLGYEKDEQARLVFYFFAFAAKMVVKMQPSAMTKSNLLTLAPLSYWEHNYTGSGSAKINIDAVQQALINKSFEAGVFSNKYIRGRGAWMDKKRIVIHDGESLISENNRYSLNGLNNSRYVYEIGDKIQYGLENPLTTTEAYKLLEACKWLNWDRDISGYLVAGWCVIAPFCGILSWRPHIWITGPAGSGKSWVIETLMRRIIGDVAIVVQGKTTEPGIRGMLQNDARPVLFDESDVDNSNDKDRIQSIIAFARSASYKDGGDVAKGTQSGGSKTFKVRTCLAFSSIGVHVNQQSDRSRFTILSLLEHEKKRSKKEFESFEGDFLKYFNEENVLRFQARTFKLLPVILKNAETFADAASTLLGQRRIGDQLGFMLAGAFSLTSEKIITYDDAYDWISGREWYEEENLRSSKDEFQLLTLIMSSRLAVETNQGIRNRTIGELIEITATNPQNEEVDYSVASHRLRQAGIIVNNDRVNIANNSLELKRIIRDSSWTDYSKILARLPDARKENARKYYSGLSSRGISLPLSLLEIESNTEEDPF